MSNTISFNYTSGFNIYCLQYNQTSGLVYNTNSNAFEIFNSANFANYVVALTDDMLGTYNGDVTSTIPDTTALSIIYWLENGGSPGINDNEIGVQNGTWTGTAMIGNYTSTLSPYAICWLEELKGYLALTPNVASLGDSILIQIINNITAQIEKITAKIFKARNIKRWYTNQYKANLWLQHVPIIGIDRMATGIQPAIKLTYQGTGIDYRVGVVAGDPFSGFGGALRILSTDSSGVKTTSMFPFKTYPTISTLATAVNAASIGWLAENQINNSITNDTLSENLNINGLQMDQGRSGVILTYPDIELAYKYDALSGVIALDYSQIIYNNYFFMMPTFFQNFNNNIYQNRILNVLCEYRAGYEVIPQDIHAVALELCMTMSKRIGTDPTLLREKIGDYSYEYLAKSLIQTKIELLQPWMRLR